MFRNKFHAPKGWKIKTQEVIDGVCYVHGTGVSGQSGSINMYRAKRISTVIGHTHTWKCTTIENGFALNVVWLIYQHRFDYGLANKDKPTLGMEDIPKTQSSTINH